MKKVLIGVGVVIGLVVVAALVAPLLIPVQAYKNQLLAQIREATGRQARIDGDFRLSIVPSLELVAGKVALANAPGAQPANMLTVDKLSARVALLPLFSGRLVVESLVLDKPVIALAVDASGRPNWRPAAAKPAPAGGGPPGGGAALVKGLTLGDIRLIDGTLTYADARSGSRYEAASVDMKLSLPALSGPLQSDGSLVWHRDKIAFRLRVDRPDMLLAGQATPAEFSLDAARLKASFRGTLAQAGRLKAQGALAVSAPSLRRVAEWAGASLAGSGKGWEQFKLTGAAAIDGADVVVRQAEISLDNATAKGELSFHGGRARPYLQAKLAIDRLDLNPYIGAATGSPAKPPAGAGRGSREWSDAPVDLAGLRRADADLDLNLAGLTLGDLKIGKTHLVAGLKAGKLVADLSDMAFYGGTGRLKITLDGSGAVPEFALDSNLSGVNLARYLADTADTRWLEGTADQRVQIAGKGRSQRAIVAALNGSGKFAARNGAIRGINLAAMVRNISSAFLDPEARKQQKTDFSELSGSYTIRNGILSNSDLDLKSPLLRVTGRGTANLAQRTVEYRIEPKLVATTVGQGGKADLSGLMVPVIVTGSWDDLHYTPDLAAAISAAGKGKALGELNKVVPGLGKGQLPGVGKVLPFGTQQAPGGLLDNLLKR